MFPYFSISRLFLILSVLAVVVVSTSTLFPFIVGKYSFFRASVDVALIFFLLGLVFHPEAGKYEERLKALFKNPLVLAVSIFTVIFLLASFFGVDPKFSFWSNFERGEGGIQIIHLFIFFAILAALFNEEHHWQKIFGWSLVAGVLMVVYGIFAGFGVQGFIGANFKEVPYRLQATIGNSSYVAAYMIFQMFYAFYLIFSKYARRLVSPGALLLWFIIFIFFMSFVATQIRGALVGLFVSVVGFLLYLSSKKKNWLKWSLLGIVLFVVIAGSLIRFRESAFVESLPGSRFFDISFSAGTLKHRTLMWEIAWQGWRERPILGWGPENFIYIFDTHFNTKYFTPENGFGSWFDRAHSIYFDYLAETGLFGLLSYLSIFAIFFWQFFRKKRIIPQGFESLVCDALLFALPLAYLVQGIVLFDVLPIHLNVFLFFAFGVYKFQNFDSKQPQVIRDQKPKR